MFVFCPLLLDPFILPHQQVDRGAIQFVLSGANIMCPGLTSPGAKMVDTDKDTVVVSFNHGVHFRLHTKVIGSKF